VKGGELAFAGAGVRRDHVDVVVEGAIRVGTAFGDVGDQLAVGRPRRQLLVVLAGGELGGLAAGDVDDIKVLVPAAEPAGVVVLELEAVSDER
jgi:hypothetical protein